MVVLSENWTNLWACKCVIASFSAQAQTKHNGYYANINTSKNYKECKQCEVHLRFYEGLNQCCLDLFHNLQLDHRKHSCLAY